MKADVLAAAQSARAVPRRIPKTSMRHSIGERMSLSAAIPSMSYFADTDMSALNILCAKLNRALEKSGKDGASVSMNDILMKLSAKLLLDMPMMNARVDGQEFVLNAAVNIGFVVALEEGQSIPNIKDVQDKSIAEIAAERADLVRRVRAGGLRPEEMSGGTFTLSDLSMTGIDSFTPVIGPPEAAILGIGVTKDRPVAKDGSVVVRPVCTLCLTADHRLADGADGAAFIGQLRDMIEDPGLFLL
jgi:pyruvate dehydrogenase E2 component (dihydrolipoamide acetyltransferase)